jgi:hypothetical protein
MVSIRRGKSADASAVVLPFARKRVRPGRSGDLVQVRPRIGARFPRDGLTGRSGLAADPLEFGCAGNPGGWTVGDFLSADPAFMVRLAPLRRMLTPPEVSALMVEALQAASFAGRGSARGVWLAPLFQQSAEWSVVMRSWMVGCGSRPSIGFSVPYHFASVEPAMLVRVGSGVRALDECAREALLESVCSVVRGLLWRVLSRRGAPVVRRVVGEWLPSAVLGGSSWWDAMELLGSSYPVKADCPGFFKVAASDPPWFAMPPGFGSEDDE